MKLALILILTFLTLNAPSSFAAGRDVPTGGVTNVGGGIVDMGLYEPVTITSFQVVPARVRARLLRHLTNRLGTSFLRRLVFHDGAVIDRRRLYRVNPDAKGYLWVIPTYILNFVFTDHANGLASYYAQIWLSSSGAVVEEITLPNMHKYSPPYSVTPLADALRTATKAGLHQTKLRVEIDYAEKLDAVVWRFSEVVADDGTVIQERNVLVDIFTGRLVKDSFSRGIH